jgi:hypothetical protein
MLRLIGAVMAVTLLSPSFNSTREGFAKYRSVEAYEVRPGILMMPRYSAEGHICEIGLEDLHYTPGLVRLDAELSRTEIDQILDQVVPDSERGPKVKDPLGTLIMRRGSSITMNIDYEYVSEQIYSVVTSPPKKKQVVTETRAAVIRWKNRECQKP